MNDRLMKQVLAKLCGMSTIIIMLAVLIFFAVVNGMNGINFLASENLSVIVNQASFLVIVGIGQAIVILTGGINLSMGAVMAFSSVLCGGMAAEGEQYIHRRAHRVGSADRRGHRAVKRGNDHKTEYPALYRHVCHDVHVPGAGVGVFAEPGALPAQ